jgi:RNA polymerase sigma-70 factor, ECF subfamily
LKYMKNLVYKGLSDEQLINEILNGDNDSFGILYNRYYSKVYSKCFSFSRNGDDAFDMTQEILLKAICNLSSFGGKSKFSTWLYSIATNYCITQTNKKNKLYHEDIRAAHQTLAEKMDEEDYEERVKWETLEARMDEYLLLLSEEERQLLVLKYRQNYSVKDLQNEFDLSASAIKMRLLRARTKMNQILSLQDAA